MSKELYDLLLKQMGYIGAENRCGRCKHFVATDISGNTGAKSSHCTLNPAVELPVTDTGLCAHFKSWPPVSLQAASSATIEDILSVWPGLAWKELGLNSAGDGVQFSINGQAVFGMVLNSMPKSVAIDKARMYREAYERDKATSGRPSDNFAEDKRLSTRG